MLKPLNITVFDSYDVYEMLLARLKDEKRVDDILGNIAEDLYDGEGIASFYLPGKDDQKFYSDDEIELTETIVTNSNLNYYDTAYIMF